MAEVILATLPARKASNPEIEYLAGGDGRPSLGGGYATLANYARLHGSTLDGQTLEMMTGDDKIMSCIRTIVAGALADDFQFSPLITLQDDQDLEEITPEDVEQAKLGHQEWERTFSSLETPLVEAARQIATSGLIFRTSVSEKVYREGTGPDANNLLLSRIKPKHRNSWALRLDHQDNILGVEGTAIIRGRDGVRTEPRVLPWPEKVIVFSWDCRDGSPIGTTILEQTWYPWNMKVQVFPLYYEYLTLFAVPNYVAKTSPDARDRIPTDPETGLPVEGGVPVPPTVAMFKEVSKVVAGGGRLFVVPAGAEVATMDPPGNGEPFQNAIDILDRSIVHSILWTTRASLEALHNSKSDNEGAQDLLALLVILLKFAIRDMIRNQIIAPQMALNRGDDWAKRFTPLVGLGRTDRQDFSKNANAMARLAQAGILVEEDRYEILDHLGVKIRRKKTATPFNQPPPTEDDDEEEE